MTKRMWERDRESWLKIGVVEHGNMKRELRRTKRRLAKYRRAVDAWASASELGVPDAKYQAVTDALYALRSKPGKAKP